MQMKIILISIGTLGDIEPFLSIGEILKEKGHQVICVFPEQFRDLAESSNMEFSSLGSKFMASPVPYIHYTRGHSHVAFNSNCGPFLNKLTYSLAGFGLITTVMISKRWSKIEERISRKQIRNAIHSNKAIYTISLSLFSRPDHWDDNIKILGNQARKKTVNWRPDRELSEFIRNHNQILFITFGSMINPAPEKKPKSSLKH
jgi:sterol 3beta-glucosyltransferase